MNLLRRFNNEEKEINNLLKKAKKLLDKNNIDFFGFDNNFSLISSKLKNHNGEYKNSFLDKFNKLKESEKTSLGYFHCYDMC